MDPAVRTAILHLRSSLIWTKNKYAGVMSSYKRWNYLDESWKFTIRVTPKSGGRPGFFVKMRVLRVCRRTEVRRKSDGFTCVMQDKGLSGKQRFYMQSTGSRSIVKTTVLYWRLSPILVVDSDGGNTTFVGGWVYCKSRPLARGTLGKVCAVCSIHRRSSGIDTVECIVMSSGVIDVAMNYQEKSSEMTSDFSCRVNMMWLGWKLKIRWSIATLRCWEVPLFQASASSKEMKVRGFSSL